MLPPIFLQRPPSLDTLCWGNNLSITKATVFQTITQRAGQITHTHPQLCGVRITYDLAGANSEKVQISNAHSCAGVGVGRGLFKKFLERIQGYFKKMGSECNECSCEESAEKLVSWIPINMNTVGADEEND